MFSSRASLIPAMIEAAITSVEETYLSSVVPPRISSPVPARLPASSAPWMHLCRTHWLASQVYRKFALINVRWDVSNPFTA